MEVHGQEKLKEFIEHLNEKNQTMKLMTEWSPKYIYIYIQNNK